MGIYSLIMINTQIIAGNRLVNQLFITHMQFMIKNSSIRFDIIKNLFPRVVKIYILEKFELVLPKSPNYVRGR